MPNENASAAVAKGLPEPSNENIDAAIASMWRTRAAWSMAADRLKQRLDNARAAVIVLGLTGTLLETTAATVVSHLDDARTACAFGGAVLLAIATFVSAKLVTAGALRAWVRARSVSETMKAEVYMFRAGAGPYAAPDTAKVLHERVSEVQHEAEDLRIHLDEGAVRDVDPPPPLSRAEYLERRVRNQIEKYYQPKVAEMKTRVAWFRRAEFGLGLTAAALGAFVGIASSQQPEYVELSTTLAAWIAVVVSVTATISAHVAANRWDFLIGSYAGTAARLQDLLNAWRLEGAPADAARWSAFVRDCEEVISSQNAAWMVKQTEQTS